MGMSSSAQKKVRGSKYGKSVADAEWRKGRGSRVRWKSETNKRRKQKKWMRRRERAKKGRNDYFKTSLMRSW